VSGALTPDLTADRHLVMFDQRGVGFSQPSLGCQELVDLKYQTIGIPLTRDQETDAVVDAAFACRDRLVASGIKLAAYTTGASAADVNDIASRSDTARLTCGGCPMAPGSPSRWSGISRRPFIAWCLIRRCLHR